MTKLTDTDNPYYDEFFDNRFLRMFGATYDENLTDKELYDIVDKGVESGVIKIQITDEETDHYFWNEDLIKFLNKILDYTDDFAWFWKEEGLSFYTRDQNIASLICLLKD